jgi:hypothetical protein
MLKKNTKLRLFFIAAGLVASCCLCVSLQAHDRNLTTSYKGQLLEITFGSNLNTDPPLKTEIDRIMDSVHLEE